MDSKWSDRWSLYENLNLGDDYYWSNLKSYPYLRWCDFSFLAFALGNARFFYSWLSRELLWKRSVLGKPVSLTFAKKNDLLYIIQCSYQALRYSFVYIDKNCQAAITFNNLGI